MTVERPALWPPLLMILKSTSSESFVIVWQSVKSAGFGSSPWELGPSPLPPIPWHTEQVSLKTAAGSAANKAPGHKYKAAIKRKEENSDLLMAGSMAYSNRRALTASGSGSLGPALALHADISAAAVVIGSALRAYRLASLVAANLAAAALGLRSLDRAGLPRSRRRIRSGRIRGWAGGS